MMLRLKELLDEMALSQKRVAYDLRMSEQTFSNYVTGRRDPDYETLIRIADYFHVSVDYLLGHETEEKPTINASHVIVDGQRFRLRDDTPIEIHVADRVITINVEELN